MIYKKTEATLLDLCNAEFQGGWTQGGDVYCLQCLLTEYYEDTEDVILDNNIWGICDGCGIKMHENQNPCGCTECQKRGVKNV